MSMSIDAVIAHFGTQADFARALGVSCAAVSQWVQARTMPPARALAVERLTQGGIRASEIPTTGFTKQKALKRRDV